MNETGYVKVPSLALFLRSLPLLIKPSLAIKAIFRNFLFAFRYRDSNY